MRVLETWETCLGNKYKLARKNGEYHLLEMKKDVLGNEYYEFVDASVAYILAERIIHRKQ